MLSPVDQGEPAGRTSREIGQGCCKMDAGRTSPGDRSSMKNHPRTALALLAVGMLALAGCGGDAAQPAEHKATPVTKPELEKLADENQPADFPDDYAGPRINVPDVPDCPYHEEVGALSDTREQIELAIDLGCEVDIHGEITFTEPLPGNVYGLISTERALSVNEMCDQGYMHPEDCQVELN